MIAWTQFYAVLMWTLGFWAYGDSYTIVPKRHIGLDIGTHRRAIDVPALWGGRVIIVTKTASMGWVIVLDTGLPGARRYHAYCHMSADRLPRPGVWLNRGERVGRLAAGPRGISYDSVDFPGTAWDGIHLHFVMSDIAHGAYTRNTGASFANPETFIREQLATLAGLDSRPFEPPAPPMEDDDMLMLTIGGAHRAALGPGIFRHFIPNDPSEKIKNLARIQDDWQDVSFSELPSLLRTYGCDLNIWDVREGQGFVVFDPLDGSVKPGGMWSASAATRAAIAGLKFPTPDPAPLVAAIKAAIESNPFEAKVDEVAIAKAVRGEFVVNPLS